MRELLRVGLLVALEEVRGPAKVIRVQSCKHLWKLLLGGALENRAAKNKALENRAAPLPRLSPERFKGVRFFQAFPNTMQSVVYEGGAFPTSDQ